MKDEIVRIRGREPQPLDIEKMKSAVGMAKDNIEKFNRAIEGEHRSIAYLETLIKQREDEEAKALIVKTES